MARKSYIVSLCLLGAVATLGSCACCAGWWDEMQDVRAENRGHGHGSGFRFFGTTSHAPVGVGGGGAGVASSRGGFGATGAAHASGG